MWFRTVPRLGAYMAIPIVYKSCLSDEALTAAIANYIEVQNKKQAQEKEIL
jgi:hypothetical protein